MEGGIGRDDHPAAQTAGGVLRLGTGMFHHGRTSPAGGPRGVRSPVPRGVDLSRRATHQLVPALPDSVVGYRGGARGHKGPCLVVGLVGIYLPQVFGVGYETIEKILD